MNRYDIAQGKDCIVEVTFRIHCASKDGFKTLLKEAVERACSFDPSDQPHGFSMGYAGPNGQQTQTISCNMRTVPS